MEHERSLKFIATTLRFARSAEAEDLRGKRAFSKSFRTVGSARAAHTCFCRSTRPLEQACHRANIGERGLPTRVLTHNAKNQAKNRHSTEGENSRSSHFLPRAFHRDALASPPSTFPFGKPRRCFSLFPSFSRFVARISFE